MQDLTTFGTFNVPVDDNTLTATFTVPGILSIESIKKIFTSIEESKNQIAEDAEEQISHGSFFGENIKQAIKAFK